MDLHVRCGKAICWEHGTAKEPEKHNEIKKNAKKPRKRHKKSEKNTRKLKKHKEFEKV